MTNENRTNFRFETNPAAPDELSDGALMHWDRLIPVIVELETARPADIPALVMLCEMLADVDFLQDSIRSDGLLTMAGSGGKKANPALKSLENARRQAEKLMDKFGLLPGISMKAPKFREKT